MYWWSPKRVAHSERWVTLCDPPSRASNEHMSFMRLTHSVRSCNAWQYLSFFKNLQGSLIVSIWTKLNWTCVSCINIASDSLRLLWGNFTLSRVRIRAPGNYSKRRQVKRIVVWHDVILCLVDFEQPSSLSTSESEYYRCHLLEKIQADTLTNYLNFLTLVPKSTSIHK